MLLRSGRTKVTTAQSTPTTATGAGTTSTSLNTTADITLISSNTQLPNVIHVRRAHSWPPDHDAHHQPPRTHDIRHPTLFHGVSQPQLQNTENFPSSNTEVYSTPVLAMKKLHLRSASSNFVFVVVCATLGICSIVMRHSQQRTKSTVATATYANYSSTTGIYLDDMSFVFFPKLYETLGLDAPPYYWGHPFASETPGAEETQKTEIRKRCRKQRALWHPDRQTFHQRPQAYMSSTQYDAAGLPTYTPFHPAAFPTGRGVIPMHPSGIPFAKVAEIPWLIYELTCSILQDPHKKIMYDLGHLQMRTYVDHTLFNMEMEDLVRIILKREKFEKIRQQAKVNQYMNRQL